MAQGYDNFITQLLQHFPTEELMKKPASVEREFGVPIPGKILDPSRWAQTALKKLPAEGTLDERFPAALAEYPGAKIHTYGKAPRPGRKVGHVNTVGDDLDDAVYEARAAASHFLD